MIDLFASPAVALASYAPVPRQLNAASDCIGVPYLSNRAVLGTCILPASMRQANAIAISICLVCGMELRTAETFAAERYEGFAYGRNNGSLLYHETHWLYRDGDVNKRLVLYSCVDGTPFARKLLIELANVAAPELDFYDAGLGYREGVSGVGAHRVVYTKARNDPARKQRELELGDDDVVDAGFDAYLRSHWDAVTPGSPLHASIVVPGRLARVPVLIAEVDDRPDSQVRHLHVQLDAWYRVITPSMTLNYRRIDRRLLEFHGIGTIRGNDGRNLDVRIVFPPALRNPSANLQDALAAARLTLSEHCHP